jgi:S1-C subfamily serine protease
LGINTFENFIQTDAAINLGIPGGALVDVNGTFWASIQPSIFTLRRLHGHRFCHPVSTAKQVLEGIVTEDQVTRGWIPGVEPQELNAELIDAFKLAGRAKAGGVIITGVL